MAKRPPKFGRGFPGCKSCIYRFGDPGKCLPCVDESNWQDEGFEEDTYEELSLSELKDLINGGLL